MRVSIRARERHVGRGLHSAPSRAQPARAGTRRVAAWRASALGLLAGASALLAPTPGGAAPSVPAAAAAVHADPYFAAWAVALAAPLSGDAAGCASSDALADELRTRHLRRAALLASLAERGLAPAPGPVGAGPWPWGPGAGDGPRVAVVDSGDTALLVDDGLLTYRNREGNLEVDPLFAARAFYAAHHDEYDFLVLCTNFPTQLGSSNFLAYHLAVANDVTGLGYTHVRSDELFADVTAYTGKPAAGRLQSFVHLNDAAAFPVDANQVYVPPYSTTTLLAHEVGHRWLARVRLDEPGTGPAPLLLGRQYSHWSFTFNSGPSPLEGNLWSADGSRFTTLDAPLAYGPLDLYLMGMLGPDEVPPPALWYVASPGGFQPPVDADGNPWSPASRPTPGVTCAGDRRSFTIQDVVLTNGIRLPAYPDARRDFRAAFAMVVPSLGSVTPQQLEALAALRASFASWFTDHTLGRGHFDATLRRVPARIVFRHRVHGDVEPTAEPIPFTTAIALEQWSLPTRLADIRVALSYAVDDGPAAEVQMTAVAPDSFVATIPPSGPGSTVRYSFRATSLFPGHEHRWPEDPGARFEFHVTADERGPSVQHVPREIWSPFAEPLRLRALVRDPHGVQAVWAEYRRAGSAAEFASLPLLPVGTSDIYEGRWALAGRPGERFEYRILARDVAGSPHTSVVPASGTHVLELSRALDEGAEFDDPMWEHQSLAAGRPDQWHHEVVNPLSGLHSWKAGPTHNVVPGIIAPRQDAVLTSPSLQVFPGGTLTFRHRYAFLLDEFSPRLYGLDGGLVEWQDVERDGPLGRWYLLEPDSGYTHWVSVGYESPLQGMPVFSGDEPFPRTEVCTLPAWVVNRTVRFRFRVATTPEQPRRAARDGWVLDDIRLDPGPPPTAVSLAALAALRTATGVQLTWEAMDVTLGDEFRIARAAGAEFAPVGHVAAVAGERRYTWEDAGAPAAPVLLYRVVLWSGGVEVASQVVRLEQRFRFALHPNVPNPFNPATRLAFELAAPGHARLALFDVRGRWVRTLLDAPLAAGPHSVTWDGTDAHGRAVASGVYLARLTSDGQTAVQRLLLVR